MGITDDKTGQPGDDHRSLMKIIGARVTRAVVSREYRPLVHTLSAVLIIAGSCLLFYQNFSHHGILMHVDMTWATSLGRINDIYRHTWMQYGSSYGLFSLMSMLWVYPSLLPAQLLHLSTSSYLLILFVGTTSLAGISMYALAYRTITSFNLANTWKYAAFAGSLVAALIYIYNPWSLGHLWAFYMYPAYALLPLIFLVTVKAFDFPSLKRIIILVILLAFATNHPINIIWVWFLVLTYALYYLVIHRFDKNSVLAALKVVGVSVPLYVAINASWIFPYLGIRLWTTSPGGPAFPGGSAGQSSLYGLSVNNTILNNLRLTSAWHTPVETNPNNTLALFLTLSLPLLALLGLFLLRRQMKRDRTVIFLAVLSLVAIVLATGTSSFFKRFYSFFVLDFLGASLGRLIRFPDRWLVFVPMLYCIVIGALCASLLRKKPDLSLSQPEAPPPVVKHRFPVFFALAIIALVLLSLSPLALAYAQTVFNPTHIPKDYDEVDRYVLDHAGKDAKVFWLPDNGVAFSYKWAPEKRIGPFNILSSNPSTSNFQTWFRADSYINWLQGFWQPSILPSVELKDRDIMLKGNLASRLLVPLSARYVIVDSSVPGYDFVTPLSRDASLKPVFQSGKLRVYEVTGGQGPIWAASRTLKVNNYWDQLAITQKLAPEEIKGTTFVDGKDSVGGEYGQLDMRRFEGDNLIPNPGFEKWNRLTPFVNWSNTRKGMVWWRDVTTKVSGQVSLKVMNDAKTASGIGWIFSDEIPAIGDSVYTFESNVKYKNTNWTHVAIEGYRQSTGEWIRLIHCPNIVAGTHDWTKYYMSFYLPPGITKLRTQLAAGWPLDRSKGQAISWFDDIKLNRISDGFFADISKAKQSRGPTVTYRKLSATKYKVHVQNPGGPFVLVFGESYDPPWVAKLPNGKTVNSAPLYSTICGFPIGQTGAFDMTIEYEPEGWFHIGFVLSMAVLLLCAVYLVRAWTTAQHSGRPS